MEWTYSQSGGKGHGDWCDRGVEDTHRDEGILNKSFRLNFNTETLDEVSIVNLHTKCSVYPSTNPVHSGPFA